MSCVGPYSYYEFLVQKIIKQWGGFIDSSVVMPSSCGIARTYEYWMQSLHGSCSGYIQLGWLVALYAHWRYRIDYLWPILSFIG
jgi:hypothetical protein